MLSFHTAGESHGQALITLVEGIPAHLDVDFEFIDNELRRRQKGGSIPLRCTSGEDPR